MANFEFVAGDRGAKLRITIDNSLTNEPFDLTAKTVTARYSLNGGSTVEKTMTVLDQATNKGQAEYQFTAADLPTGGTLMGEARVQAGLSDQLTTVDNFNIAVKTPLP